MNLSLRPSSDTFCVTLDRLLGDTLSTLFIEGLLCASIWARNKAVNKTEKVLEHCYKEGTTEWGGGHAKNKFP